MKKYVSQFGGGEILVDPKSIILLSRAGLNLNIQQKSITHSTVHYFPKEEDAKDLFQQIENDILTTGE